MPAATSASELIDDREYAAPPALVFEVWTRAEHFARWFAPEQRFAGDLSGLRVLKAHHHKLLVVAPLAGSVARVLVKVGDEIEAGQVLLLLEAMKMETEITAPAAGVVSAILVAPGDAVQGGQALIEL